jgi:hypothetical protein
MFSNSSSAASAFFIYLTLIIVTLCCNYCSPLTLLISTANTYHTFPQLGPDALPANLKALLRDKQDEAPKPKKTKSLALFKSESGDRITEIISGQNVDSNEEKNGTRSTEGSAAGSWTVPGLIVFGVLVLGFNLSLTMALQPGSTLHAGDSMRKCGVWSLTLEEFSGCSEMRAEFDGLKMNVYRLGTVFGDETKSLVYTIAPEIEKGGDDKSKSAGLVIADDGTISIAGKTALVAAFEQSEAGEAAAVSPWPIATDVQLKKMKKRGNKVLYKLE